jgi:hypothetical protein
MQAGVIPDYVRLRQMSVRAYDAAVRSSASCLICEGVNSIRNLGRSGALGFMERISREGV